MCVHVCTFVTPVVEHWLEQEGWGGGGGLRSFMIFIIQIRSSNSNNIVTVLQENVLQTHCKRIIYLN